MQTEGRQSKRSETKAKFVWYVIQDSTNVHTCATNAKMVPRTVPPTGGLLPLTNGSTVASHITARMINAITNASTDTYKTVPQNRALCR